MLNAIKDTTKHVYWNSRDHCYVAVMSDVPTCRAEGANPAEAISNLERCYARGEYLEAEPRLQRAVRTPGYMPVLAR
ncbi:hypothetical protein [Opitutus sp. ER46]|uniref:type II toxin-antitoxin system HicB family antitoxin n=1 Tax=Opitutus sp. ER46 TaxID=2161864 RepID=UPI000D30756A|nr:hypothetical protein [Opitutus sp. ER46]PTX98417.1 hypothetical protein DB354_03875 [Opitutus sp. ER46]